MNMWSDNAAMGCFIAGEDIRNNAIYILNIKTGTIHNIKSVDDLQIGLLVLVYNNPSYETERKDDFLIKAGTMCRCWKIKITW